MIETAKNILKLCVYAALAYFTISHALRVDAATLTGADQLVGAMRANALRLLLLFVAAAALFAILDQLIARRDFTAKMRMSRREIRRELRDREGEPRLKQRRQKLHREFAKNSQSLRNIRGADLLITNPTHYAVALKYDARRMDAPVVVARGANQLALRLKKLAFVYGLVVIENRALAQALFFKSDLNRPVPETFFRPVADIYIDIERRKAKAAERPAHA
jgi:flagellar biosynthetic protein FlhB